MLHFLSQYTFPVIWAAALVILVVVEAATTNLVTIWFAVGALAALLVSLFSENFILQMLVFAVVSILALALTKPLVKRMRHKKPAAPVGLDCSVGKRAQVLTPIRPGEHGRVRLDGVDWLAICDTPLEPGSSCIVKEINCTTLTVAPVPCSVQAD